MVEVIWKFPCCVDWFSGQDGLDPVNMEDAMADVKRKIVVRDGFSHGPDFDPGIDCSVDPDTGEELVSMTKQSFADECDINNIMRRYETTGTIDHVNRRMPEFGDFTGLRDFADAMNVVIEAEHLFSELPARIRDRFGNDPSMLLEWLQDPKNRDEAVELGIVAAPPPEAPPTRVEVVNPSTPQPKGPEGRLEPAGGPAT